ncbi:glycosyltransferase [Mycobacterium deserti]|uniref:Glycosyltransferase n=1 Tax=Mycobacterium deserti TaxID=2978347 RepID=A0ABT2MFK5_9MYCO|nr:glycosyltransferase [Mycobacterium deserti]MCT7660160.1 glycosyltransferase [Mycobacterium deserti]
MKTPEMDRAYLKTPATPVATRLYTAEHQLAVAIVTYRSHELLEKCLAQVAEHMPELPVYVYENSGDDYPGRDELVARNPHVHWVVGKTNIGFAAAFNALVEHTPPDADLLLLNPDAKLLGPLTRTRSLIRAPGVAAVSPLLWDNHGPGSQPWDVATRRRTVTRALVAAAGYSDRFRGTPLSHLYRTKPAESQQIEGYLGGACLAINRDTWDSIGGFDEEFFLYGEETDWQNRARAAGWKILLADEIGADHRGDTEDAPASGAPARGRSYELLRANTALLLEHEHSVHHADAYLAGTTVLDRLQRSKRDIRRRATAGDDTGRPHIVITTNRLVYGGAERQKVLLATELDRRGYPVTLVCMQRFGPLIKEVPPSVRVVRQPWWAPLVDGPEGPAVIITGDTNTEAGFGTLWRAAGANRRWLVGAHEPPEDDRPIYSRGLAAAMRRADGFVALAQRHWQMLTENHRMGDTCFVAPNGVTPVAPPPRRRDPGAPVHLVMLSRIVEHKNPHVLIDALAHLPELPWRLSIYGEGPDRAELEARTPSYLRDRVAWRGWSRGPDPALGDADLLCVPSRSEGFPLVIVEAMARAVPVAASAVCAVPEMLDHGRAGFVVDDVTVKGWRHKLAEILADPGMLPEVGYRGFERMSSRYTVEAMTDAYLEAIGAVL